MISKQCALKLIHLTKHIRGIARFLNVWLVASATCANSSSCLWNAKACPNTRQHSSAATILLNLGPTTCRYSDRCLNLKCRLRHVGFRLANFRSSVSRGSCWLRTRFLSGLASPRMTGDPIAMPLDTTHPRTLSPRERTSHVFYEDYVAKCGPIADVVKIATD